MEEKKTPKQYAQEEAKKLRAAVEGKETPTTKNLQQTKMSYEQLNDIAHQLSDQNMQLRRQLQIMDLSNFFKRLDYLFKVMEFSHMFDDDFTDTCAKEIQSSLTINQESTGGSEEKPQESSKGSQEEQEDGDESSDLNPEDELDEELEGILPR